MQEPSKSDTERQTEVLVWMGTAYGRRGSAMASAQPIEDATTSSADASISDDQELDHWAPTLGPKIGVAAGLAALFAIGAALAFVQVRAPAAPGVSQIATSEQPGPQVAEPPLPPKADERQAELEQATSDAKMQLASEHEARIALEGQVGQLTSELAAQKLKQQNAENANATASAALAAERKARAEAEAAVKSSQEELARMAKTAAAAAVAALPVAAAPVPPAAASVSSQPAQSEPKPIADHAPAWEANVRVVNASLAIATGSDPASSALLRGERLFAKGDVEEARQQFEQAARMGMPEAALALGNTYDRVSLEMAGLNLPGDALRARQWYRRAIELAQNHQEPAR